MAHGLVSTGVSFPDASIQTTAAGAGAAALKAWVHFTVTSTPSVTASLNVSSVTYVTTAQWTVNFTTAFADINYATICDVNYGTFNNYNYASQMREDRPRRTKTTSACPVAYYDTITGQWTPTMTTYAYIVFLR